MTPKEEQLYKGAASALNNVRMAYSVSPNRTIYAEEFRKLLKNCKLPSNNVFWAEFLKLNWLIKVDRSSFRFPTSPIHFVQLYNAHLACKNRLRAYNGQNKVIVPNQETKTECEESSIEAAIKLLKENGYLIYKLV